MKFKVLRKHFDKAVKQNWSHMTCVIAQAAKDQNVHFDGNRRLSGVDMPRKLIKIQKRFDDCFTAPGDERKRHAQNLRNSLPIYVELP